MINYIIQVILFQVLFLAIYDLFLSKETFFTKNRWYLLSTPILSFFIPLIKIPNIEKVVSQEFTVNLPEIILSPEKMILQTISSEDVMTSNNYINLLFWAGVVLFSILFLVKLFRIITLIKKHKAQKLANVNLIVIPDETKAFSFFNYIFLGEKSNNNCSSKSKKPLITRIKGFLFYFKKMLFFISHFFYVICYNHYLCWANFTLYVFRIFMI